MVKVLGYGQNCICDMSQGGAQGLWYLRGPQTGHQQCLLLFIQTREVSHLQNLVSQKLFYKINILTQYVIKIQWTNCRVLFQEHIFGFMPHYQWSSWMKYFGKIFSHATSPKCCQNMSEFRIAWFTCKKHEDYQVAVLISIQFKIVHKIKFQSSGSPFPYFVYLPLLSNYFSAYDKYMFLGGWGDYYDDSMHQHFSLRKSPSYKVNIA